MNLHDFESLLQQSDLAFVDAIETEAFQTMLETDFDFYTRLGDGSRWRLLFGLWVVLLDVGDDPTIPWRPSMVSVPGLPSRLCLDGILQALVVADFDINRIDWSDELGCASVADQHVYASALRSQACQQLVEQQIEAGLKRVLACDVSPSPCVAADRQPSWARKALAAFLTLFDDQMPRFPQS